MTQIRKVRMAKNKVSTLSKACPKCGRPVYIKSNVEYEADGSNEKRSLSSDEIKRAVTEEMKRQEEEKNRRDAERIALEKKEADMKVWISNLKWAGVNSVGPDYLTVEASSFFKKKYKQIYYSSIKKIVLTSKSEMIPLEFPGSNMRDWELLAK